jgi:hypothetical protein
VEEEEEHIIVLLLFMQEDLVEVELVMMELWEHQEQVVQEIAHQ